MEKWERREQAANKRKQNRGRQSNLKNLQVGVQARARKDK